MEGTTHEALTPPEQDFTKSASSDPTLEPISLAELIATISDELHEALSEGSPGDMIDLKSRTRIAHAMRALDVSSGCLEPFTFFDEHKCYTRNLVATDHETFTLLLLCWNEGKASPIHDHPCRGCWMRVCEGSVFETRYNQTKEGDEGSETLTEAGTHVYRSPQAAYVHDMMGLHKVGPAGDGRACTLHLYAPPFDSCRVWLDAKRADRVLRPTVTFYSEYGEIVDYSAAPLCDEAAASRDASGATTAVQDDTSSGSSSSSSSSDDSDGGITSITDLLASKDGKAGKEEDQHGAAGAVGKAAAGGPSAL